MIDVVLSARGLKKEFVSGARTINVLDGAEISIRAGESVSIRGESGSGKTTMLNILSGLERPDAGNVYWEDRDIAHLHPRTLAPFRGHHIGMVFQSFYLVPEIDALGNVLLPARIHRRLTRADRQRAKELLEAVGMGDRLDANVSVLSGGERQRVAVARALINRPRVILADEPTGNLDEHTAESVMKMLIDVTINEGASLVLVTHSAVFAELTQRKVRLHDGKLTEF